MKDATKKSAVIPTRPNWPTNVAPLGREAVRERQREKILQATVELVAKRGFNGSSLERICKDAGVSFPTFRKHFRDKEDCFLAAFDDAVERGKARVLEAVENGGDGWAERISAGLAALLEAIEDDPARARVCLVESLTAGPTGFDRYETAVRMFQPALRLGRGEVDGGDELPPLLEETIAGGIAWSVHQRVASGDIGQVGDLFQPLLETVLTPYLGEAEAKRFADLERSSR